MMSRNALDMEEIVICNTCFNSIQHLFKKLFKARYWEIIYEIFSYIECLTYFKFGKYFLQVSLLTDSTLPRECDDLSYSSSGVYTIYPDGIYAVQVYCIIANNEKWTVSCLLNSTY